MASALYDSLIWDKDEYPNYPSPSGNDLASQYATTIRRLASLNILLGKTEAIEYLGSLNIAVPAKSFRQNDLSEVNYQRVFRRRAAKHGRKMLFTLAEVRYLSGDRTVGNCPADLQEMT